MSVYPPPSATPIFNSSDYSPYPKSRNTPIFNNISTLLNVGDSNFLQLLAERINEQTKRKVGFRK
jgi:hypothetical protein